MSVRENVDQVEVAQLSVATEIIVLASIWPPLSCTLVKYIKGCSSKADPPESLHHHSPHPSKEMLLLEWGGGDGEFWWWWLLLESTCSYVNRLTVGMLQVACEIVSLTGPHTLPGQHSQPTLTSFGQRCMCV